LSNHNSVDYTNHQERTAVLPVDGILNSTHIGQNKGSSLVLIKGIEEEEKQVMVDNYITLFCLLGLYLTICFISYVSSLI
jgi:hypothetical protein